MPLRFPPRLSVFICVAKVSYGLVGGGGGVSRRKMICCGYECLTDPLECSPSIRLHPPTCSLPPSHHLTVLSLSLAVAAAPARSEPPPPALVAAEMEVCLLNWNRRLVLQTCLMER